jgi:hypothetical protein
MANTSTRLTVGLVVLVVTGVAVWLLMQREAQTKLAEENAALREQVVQLQAENENLSKAAAESKAVEPPPAPSDEILRLRAEVGVLRQQTNELGQGLQQHTPRMVSLLPETLQLTNELSAEDRVTLEQTHLVDAVHAILGALKDYAAKHNGQYPDNLQELVTSGILPNSKFAGGVGLEDFEFHKPDPKEPSQNQNMLRALNAIQRPGGTLLIVSGGIDEAGNVRSEVRNWSPQ